MTSDGSGLSEAVRLAPVPPDLLREAVAAGSDLCIIVSAEGHVQQVLCGAQMANLAARLQAWVGQPMAAIFTHESAAKLRNRLAEAGNLPSGTMTLELNHEAGLGLSLPLRYVITRAQTGGELLFLGRDLRPLADVQQRLVEAQLALQRDYEAQREVETRYRVLLEVNTSPIIIVSVSSGKIVDLNGAAVTLIGGNRAELIDTSVAQEFEGRRRGEFLESLTALAGAETGGSIELTVLRSRKRVQVVPTLFRAGGDKLLLCRIELTEVARTQDLALGESLTRMFQQGVDGMVFLDGNGVIKAANEAFLNMTDSPNQGAVLGRSLAEFMTRGEVDLRVLMDNVKRVGRLRTYSSQLNTDFGGQVSVQMSATAFGDKANPMVGLVLRDAAAVEGMRWPAGAPGNEGLRNVMQLVGYSALKEIVAETTDIIEKMCIEAALELTGNNRVAAAELLSLSRQSLYVKLRKFGMLSKSGD